VGELLARLAVEESAAEIADVRRLLLRDLALARLAQLQRDAMAATDIGPHVQAIAWLKAAIEAIGADAPPDPAGEAELLGWLAHQGGGDA
jgi:hypothetical protein